jgi:hypothetical protein
MTAIKRQIDATDRQRGQLVSGFYGLTAEEIISEKAADSIIFLYAAEAVPASAAYSRP